MARVSVIIPTYNRAGFVFRAVESILEQKFADYEVIVVDDGSTDNTGEILKKYKGEIHLIKQANAGVSAARNTGIREARGRWVAFLDSDDEWLPDYLGEQIGRLEEQPGILMQSTDCLFIGLNGEKRRYFEMNGAGEKFLGRDYAVIERPFRFVIGHGPWQVGSTIIRRDALLKAGLFDEDLRLTEDLDLMARVALQGPFGMIRKPLVNIYRRDEETECLTNQVQTAPIKARLNDERIYEKLMKLQGLSPGDRTALNEVMAANRRAIGNILVREGNMGGARDSYWRAFCADKSMASLGKIVIASLPKKVSSKLIEKTLRAKTT